MLRWLKTVVVSDVEKAHEMRQVGIRKAIVDEVSLVYEVASKPGYPMQSRDESGGFPICWPGGVRHGWRREPGLLLSYGTGEGAFGYCCLRVATGSVSSGANREGLSTVAERAGGPARSSGEAAVTVVERRGRVVRGLFV